MYAHTYVCVVCVCVCVCLSVCTCMCIYMHALYMYMCLHTISSLTDSISIFTGPYLYYQCTTEKGSSGSPVLKEVDGELKIVALHRGTKDSDQNHPGYNCGTLIREIDLA